MRNYVSISQKERVKGKECFLKIDLFMSFEVGGID